MEFTVNAKFVKQVKDSKKELLAFSVEGDDENKPEIYQMARESVIVTIQGIKSALTCEYKKASKDNKKTVIELIVQGDTSAKQTFEFYKLAGNNVALTIQTAQADIEDYKEPHEGVKGKIDKYGNATVDENQSALEV